MREPFDQTREYTYNGMPYKVYAVYPNQQYPVHGAFQNCEGHWCVRCLKYEGLAPVPRITHRKATKEDAARALMGEEVKCRVRDHDSYDWHEAVLLSYIPSEITNSYHWVAKLVCDHTSDKYEQCEVEVQS